MQVISTVVGSRPVAFLAGAMIVTGDQLTAMSTNVQQFTYMGSDNAGCNMRNVDPGSFGFFAGQCLKGFGITLLTLGAAATDRTIADQIVHGAAGGFAALTVMQYITPDIAGLNSPENGVPQCDLTGWHR